MPAPPRYIWPVAAPDPWSLVQTDEWRIIEHTVTLKHRRQVMRLFTIPLGEARYKVGLLINCRGSNDLTISPNSFGCLAVGFIVPTQIFP